MDCIEEYGIEKVFTVTVDNAKNNDKALEIFTDALRLKGGGALANPSIVAIRNAVKYVRSSFSRLRSFAMRCETGKISCTVTYFEEVEERSKVKRIGPPTSVDWEEAERNLNAKASSPIEEIRKQAYVMRHKFEKSWARLHNMNPLVIMTSAFDPHNKMEFASLCFEKIYGKDTIESKQLQSLVSSAMKRLYEDYSLRLSQPTEDEDPPDFKPTVLCDISDDDDCELMGSLYSQLVGCKRSEDGSNELQIYLTEKTEVRVENSLGLPYDVLSWWRCNSSKFPILSELARDVLAIQVSSVSSESAFSTSVRVLDSYRSSLTPYMVEVLICAQKWLKSSHKSEAQVSNLVQMLEEVEFLESLDSQNSVAALP
ncbi:PREDICTED: zinc finger BED domain-containing protein RICESLEEPER 2-like [Camelina sativa]|uniref:Zinc finger BED domain-containing protein RICESLEEPER 2-like n=1 Tax=Camelina sativa TaxID=90675 RepID=A0ABM1REK1_CAMSA|nr:PREDICTED: zinc finger BED domain-containing protein RICESLEEPER 2-like [Camelina sativa]